MNCPFLKVGTIVPSNGVSFSVGPMQSLALTATTASTSTSTGSLVAAGGAGIAGDLYTSSIHAVATTASTSVTTGSLVAAGGAGIAGDLYVSSVHATATTASTSITTGSFVAAGGAGIAGAAYIGSIVSTTPGTAAGQVLRYEDMTPVAATTVSGNWTWGGTTELTGSELTVINFARIGNMVSIYQSAANTGIYSSSSANTQPTFSFTGSIPASFRTATTRQTVIPGHYSGAPAAFAMQASGTGLTMQYIGVVDTTAPGTVAAGSFVFNYVV